MPQGRPPKPPDQKVNRNKMKYEWSEAPGAGWRFGAPPECPDGLMAETREAWDGWFRSWWSAYWELEDVPYLRNVAKLFDEVVRHPDDKTLHAELRQQSNVWGLTPKGRTDNRWLPPKEQTAPEAKAAAPRLKVV